MAITDTLNATMTVELIGKLDRTNSAGYTGKDVLSHTKTQPFSDGSGSGGATIWFNTSFDATTGGITISLADSADPLGGAGDDAPTADPEGKKIKAVLIENTDDTNYIELSLGTNAVTNWLGGTTPTVRIPAGGFLAQTFPAGIDAINDGSDDEIKISADTASVTTKISILYG